MEKYFQQLIEHTVRTNQLLEQQNQILKKQQESLVALNRGLADLHDVQLSVNNLLNKELIHLLEQPLLDKNQVMDKLNIKDSTYRRYVKEGYLQPMGFEKIDWYFGRDLVKALEESRRKGRI
ncbi:hypothetical protein [Sphingobacterium pedocola]|uniref:Helix-turn-helix domain-containing protein n=1 Tax=Sphingobacterium pedocola TaxID=2082722 RepID=A0ABR9T7N8_9SPHI|nr:hypothetical protein [Sphingobacterium pedocola]MBE8721356.1 hypothetical protein [Sphingobacterium pedocola]